MTTIKARIPELYHSVDMDGVIVDCGIRYAERLGYAVDEIIGTPFFDHASANARDDLRASFEEWKKTGSTNTSKRTQLETRNGDTVDVILAVRNRHEDGKRAGRDAVMREVSHIEDLQKLYNVHARPGYDDPAILHRSVNYMGTIIDCNQAYLDNLGYTKDEVVGTSLYEHTGAKSVGNLITNMENWRTGNRTHAKIWMKRKDGSEFRVGLDSTDETDSDGTIVGRTVSLKPL